MKYLGFILGTMCTITVSAHAGEVLFEDSFANQVGAGWLWIRERKEAWRATPAGLEVRVEPGNMWGAQNDARNVLVRDLPEGADGELEIMVSVENNPAHQYEQVDMVWYFDDSNMVKIGQELVDGKLSIVMGREERDQCRTIAIIPLRSTRVQLRFVVTQQEIRGAFRTPEANDWHDAGKCTLPRPPKGTGKISLQFYQGSEKLEHWARVKDFRILKHR